MHQCELLYGQGRIYDAAESLREIESTVNEDVRGNKFIFEWLAGEFRHRALGWCTQSPSEVTHRCVTTLERIGDEASNIEKHDEAVAAYSTALLLGPSDPNNVLIKWARRMLVRGSAHEALSAAVKVCSA